MVPIIIFLLSNYAKGSYEPKEPPLDPPLCMSVIHTYVRHDDTFIIQLNSLYPQYSQLESQWPPIRSPYTARKGQVSSLHGNSLGYVEYLASFQALETHLDNNYYVELVSKPWKLTWIIIIM